MIHTFYDFADVRTYLGANFAYSIPYYNDHPELLGYIQIYGQPDINPYCDYS